MIMKPDKNFKLPKQVKRTMATLVNAVERNAYKNLMIQAQLHSNKMERQSGKKDKSKSNVAE
jgi:hypothetical protein